MLDDHIGYIALHGFSNPSSDPVPRRASPSCSTTAPPASSSTCATTPAATSTRPTRSPSEFIKSGLIFTQESAGGRREALGGDRRRPGHRPEDPGRGAGQQRVGLRLGDRECGAQGARAGDDHRPAHLSARTPCSSGIRWRTAAACGSRSPAGSPRITTAWRRTASSRTSRSTSRTGRRRTRTCSSIGPCSSCTDRALGEDGASPGVLTRRGSPVGWFPPPHRSPTTLGPGGRSVLTPAIAQRRRRAARIWATKGGGVQ